MMLDCPQCGVSTAFRVLADAVTLVCVGSCVACGTVELSRVSIAEVPTHSSYKPGPVCGRRLGDSFCRLPKNHQEGHAS